MIKFSKLSEHLSLGKGSGSSLTSSTVRSNGFSQTAVLYNFKHPSAHKSGMQCANGREQLWRHVAAASLAKLKCRSLLEVKVLLTVTIRGRRRRCRQATDALLLLFIVSPPPCEDDNIATFEATLLQTSRYFTSPCSDNKRCSVSCRNATTGAV